MPLRTHDAPLVDRLDELRVLRNAFAAAADRGGVLTMVADAGVGKTRLASELSLALAASPTATHVGRCAPYGDGPSWLPLAEALRPAVGDADAAAGLMEDADAADSVRRAVGAVLGESAGAMPAGEMHWALARLLEALARDRPRLVVLEDVHWAADTLLDFVEYLRARPPRGHVLVLALARPDLWTRRPGWADERSVRLEPLPEDDSRVLLARLGMDDPRLTRELVGVAGGNPFFLQQLLAHVSERGQVTGLPGTIDAVMAARLDALAPEERRVVERAAVAGRDFSRLAVAELAEDEGTDRALLALLRRGLLQVSRDGSAPDMLRFSHALLHEAAYGSIPRDRRAAMHERLAAFEAAAPEAHDEVVGSHLERAHRDWAAVDASHPGLDALAERGGRRLGVAGIRAWQRSDAASAASLLDRATRLLPAGHPERPALYPELAMARELAGDRDGALAALAEAAATSADVGDEATTARARIELAQLRFVAGRASAEDVLDATAAAIPVLTSAGDDRALGRAWLLRGLALGGARCDNAAWAEAAGTALEHYRRAGWPVGAVVSGIAAASYHGPTPAAETIARCDGLLEDASAGRLARSYVALYRAGARAMTGAFDDARQEADDARAVAEELEAATFGRDYGQVRGAIEVLAGDPVAAESVYRTTLAALVERGETAYAAHRAAELAGVLYDLGRFEEAAAHVRRSRSLAIDDDLPTRFLRASVEAKLAARDGDLGAALELAREAAALAGATDALNQRAQVGLDLATVLRAAGREGEATAAEEEALRLLEAKGNVAALVRIGAGDTPRT
jgi:tetratricopeptide (TPR) repeat protein